MHIDVNDDHLKSPNLQTSLLAGRALLTTGVAGTITFNGRYTKTNGSEQVRLNTDGININKGLIIMIKLAQSFIEQEILKVIAIGHSAMLPGSQVRVISHTIRNGIYIMDINDTEQSLKGSLGTGAAWVLVKKT